MKQGNPLEVPLFALLNRIVSIILLFNHSEKFCPVNRLNSNHVNT